jgi:hypothetical protein
MNVDVTTDPNGGVQWLLNRPIPTAVQAPPTYGPYSYPATIPGNGIYVSTDEHFKLLEKCHEFNRSLLKDDHEHGYNFHTFKGNACGCFGSWPMFPHTYRPYPRDIPRRPLTIEDSPCRGEPTLTARPALTLSPPCWQKLAASFPLHNRLWQHLGNARRNNWRSLRKH